MAGGATTVFTADPSPESAFALIDKLDSEPVEGPNGKVGLEEVFFPFDNRVDMTGKYEPLSPYMPLMIDQLEKGDTTIYDRIAAGELPPKPATADDDTVRAAAQAADDVQPVGIGKAQVEDNGAVFYRRPGGLAAAGGIDGVNGEAFLFQAVLYEFGKPFVIFDQ